MLFITRKEVFFGTLSFGVAFIFAFVLATLIVPNFLKGAPSAQIESQTETSKALVSDPPKESDINVALLGSSGAGHDGGGLTDAILLLNISTESKKARIISIPRDLWVNLPSGENKINHAMSQGPGALKDAITEVTGITPQYFITIDFSSFTGLIDQLGGVTVNVPVGFDDRFYPIKGLENETCGFSPEKIKEVHEKYSGFDLEKQFECRYEHLHFESGPNKMNGETALKFVRSRHSGQHGGDFARSERQQALLVGLLNSLLDKNVIENVQKTFESLRRFVDTDLDITRAIGISEIIVAPQNYEIKHVLLTTSDVLSDGKSQSGAYILFPKAGFNKWNEVHSYISSH